jgi:glycerophosphoryl diester phosphodiesterase
MTSHDASDPDGVAFCRNGHRTLFKWHRGRRRRDDVNFTAARIVEGLRLGAGVEVDLNRHAGGGFAVLHDATLDGETDGTGAVAEKSAAELRKLRLRREDGTMSGEPLMLLGDLAAALADESLPPGALLQLDLKERADGLAPGDVAAFRSAAAPIAGHLIVSGADAEAVALLAGGVPGIRVGFDPCRRDSFDLLSANGDFAAFIARGLETGQGAEMIYLDYRIVVLAAGRGFDMVGAVHAAGKTVDAWTLNTDHPAARDSLRTLLGLKVDQITTDEPVALHRMALEVG